MRCKACNIEKDQVDFLKDKNCSGGYKPRCRECYLNKIPKLPEPIPEFKVCKTCGEEKVLTDFRVSSNKKYKHGRTPHCKICVSSYERNRVMSNPEKKAKLYAKHNIYRKNNPEIFKSKLKHIITQYNKLGIQISEEEYNKVLKEQNNRCAICNNHDYRSGRLIKLSIDHCHDTLKFRGLLCGNCNRALGLLKDDVEVLKKAIEYLNRNS